MESPTVFICFTVGTLLGLMAYFICRLRREESLLPPIVLAEEKQQALEQKRREKLAKCIDPHTMKVQEENLKYVIQCSDIESNGCSEEPVDSYDPDGMDESEVNFSPRLMIHRGINELGKQYIMRSARCAICIDDYRVGDEVVESSNSSCPHVYHRECIMTWLSKDINSCCPICRQIFIVSDEAQDIIATTV